MKNVICFLTLLATLPVAAQNKSLGVGVTNPSTNAALHVESPTNNQGFIMPRLTTAERNAMSLNSTDNGLMVYDETIKNIFIWDGTAWKLTAVTTSNYMVTDVASTTPALSATTSSNQAGGKAFSGVQKGTGDAAGSFIVENTTNTHPAVYGENRGAGSGIKGNVTTGAGAAVQGTSAGTGNAGLFENTNSSNGNPTVLITNAGNGNALETAGKVKTGALTATTIAAGNISVGDISAGDVEADAFITTGTVETGSVTATGNVTGAAFIGDGSQLTGVAATNLTLPATLNQANAGLATAALTITNAGTGNAIETTGDIQAGYFIGDGSNLTNVSVSPFSYPYTITEPSSTPGTATIEFENTGTGRTGNFIINNASNTAYALAGETNGANLSAGVFGNNTGDGFGVFGKSNGTSFGSAAVYGEQTGTGDAAGAFRINNASSTYSGLYGETNGSGSAIFGAQLGLGRAGQFQITNPSNTDHALRAYTDGTGRAGFFTISNAGNSAAAIFVETNGTGPAVQTTGRIEAGQFVGDGSLLTGTKLQFPYIDTVTTAPANSNLFRIVYDDATVQNVGVAHFENLNSNSAFTTLFVRNAGTNSAGYFQQLNNASNSPALRGITNSNESGGHGTAGYTTGTGGSAGYFQVTSATNANAAVAATTNGTGAAGQFSITNPASTAYAVKGETNGAALSAGVYGNNTGDGFGVFGKSNGMSFGSAAVYGEHTGTGDAAGAFRISNASNTYSALYGETNGSGSSIFGSQLGLGRAGQFQITNASNTEHALRAYTDGTGRAGFFTINNAASTSYAVVGETNGDVLSAGVYGNNTGGGFGVVGKSNGSALGSAAVYGEQKGTGDAAGAFRIDNSGNASNAVYGETNGTASAINANQIGTGTGLTAQINNGSNSANAIRGITNGTGNGLLINHTGVSGNVAVFQSSDVNVARIDKTGKGFFNSGTQTGGADLAEAFEVEGSVSTYEPGDVLVISETTDRTVEKSSSANSRKVVGVYATKPGVLLTEKGIDDDLGNTVPMGVIGVIPTKVCLENGPIKRGDLLVTSSETGKAMKAKPVIIEGLEIYPNGAILGKALENYDGTGAGLIKVLVNVK